MCYQNFCVIQQSYNIKSYLGTKEILCVIRNSVLSGHVLTSCHCNSISQLNIKSYIPMFVSWFVVHCHQTQRQVLYDRRVAYKCDWIAPGYEHLMPHSLHHLSYLSMLDVAINSHLIKATLIKDTILTTHKNWSLSLKCLSIRPWSHRSICYTVFPIRYTICSPLQTTFKWCSE